MPTFGTPPLPICMSAPALGLPAGPHQQATIRTCDSPSQHRNQKPTRDSYFLVTLPQSPISTLHPLSPCPKQVRPTVASMTPMSQFSKVGQRDPTFPDEEGKWTPPEDQTFEMYRDSTGRISVGGWEAMVEIVSCLSMPTPLHVTRPSASLLPETSEGYTCSPFKSCSVEPTL